MKHFLISLIGILSFLSSFAQVQFDAPVNLSNQYGPSKNHSICNIGENYYLAWDQWGDLMFRRSTNAGLTWSNKITIYSSLDNGAYYPVIASANGMVYVFYYRYTTSNSEIFMLKSTNDGQSFGSEVQITSSIRGAQVPQITASGDTLVLAYEDRDINYDYQIYVMTSVNAGQSWSAAQKISNTNQGARWCNIGLQGNRIIALWNDQTGSSYDHLDLFFTKSEDFGQNWSNPLNISNNQAYNARLKTKIAGNSIYTVVSSKVDGLQTDIMLYRSHNWGDNWETAINLSANAGASERPDVWADASLAGNHRIYAVWSDGSYTGNDKAYLKYSVDHGQNWSEMMPFSQNTEDASWPQIIGFPQSDADQLYMAYFRPHDGTFDYEIWGVKAVNQLEENITFSGYVTDSDGLGIGNALITLNGLSYEVNDEGYFEIQLLPGTYNVVVKAEGFISWSDPAFLINQNLNQDFILQALLFPPLNLTGEVVDQSVQLSWDEPASEGTWVHWDDGQNSDAVGGSNIEIFDAAIRFTPQDLLPYEGLFLTRIAAFFASADAEFNLRVWQGGNQNYAGNLIMEQVVSNPVANEWNIINLDNPVQVDASQELWIGYRVINPSGAYPAGTDNGPAIPFKGDMLLYGADWRSMSDYFGWNINWNIQGFLVDNGREVTLLPAIPDPIPTNTGLPGKVSNQSVNSSFIYGFSHFRVYRNESLLAEIPADNLSYTDHSPLDDNYYFVTSGRDQYESVPSNIVYITLVGVYEAGVPQTGLKTFPNPVKENVLLQFELSEMDNLQLEFFDMHGAKVYSKRYNLGAGPHSLFLNRNEFSPVAYSGVLLLRLIGRAHEFGAKIIIK
ncbi:MAG: exo-alpha-sialidase [Lentimicrobium sp.]|nr:exo-alpha-sialidase [Lentimicrobium sp.]